MHWKVRAIKVHWHRLWCRDDECPRCQLPDITLMLSGYAINMLAGNATSASDPYPDAQVSQQDAGDS